MNEKLIEFAKQVGLCDDDGDFYTGEPYDYQKFAELIIRECVQLILDKKMGDLGDNPGVKEWEEGYNEAVHDCYYLIRKHFGVEE